MSDRRQKIERLYNVALEHEESGRAAYFQGVCSKDDALRQEVESLEAQECGEIVFWNRIRWRSRPGQWQ